MIKMAAFVNSVSDYLIKSDRTLPINKVSTCFNVLSTSFSKSSMADNNGLRFIMLTKYGSLKYTIQQLPYMEAQIRFTGKRHKQCGYIVTCCGWCTSYKRKSDTRVLSPLFHGRKHICISTCCSSVASFVGPDACYGRG
jgi:hypothetical protein